MWFVRSCFYCSHKCFRGTIYCRGLSSNFNYLPGILLSLIHSDFLVTIHFKSIVSLRDGSVVLLVRLLIVLFSNLLNLFLPISLSLIRFLYVLGGISWHKNLITPVIKHIVNFSLLICILQIRQVRQYCDWRFVIFILRRLMDWWLI